MNRRFSKKSAVATATVAVVVALLALALCTGGRFLTLTDVATGKTVARYRMAVGDEFSVEFLHSINRTPVRDVYEIREKGRIFNTSCIYYSFGTGVQTQLNEGESLRYEDGAMIISGIERDCTDMIYQIRSNSTHVLRVAGREIFLPPLLSDDTQLAFTCPWLPFGRWGVGG